MTKAIELLDKLADVKAMIDAVRLHYQELRDNVLTPEQRQQLADIDAELESSIEPAQATAAALEAEVKAEVIKAGASVKGAHLHAVWAKPRVSWDTKALDGYAVAHPELLAFRKEGDASVSIRNI